LFPGKFKQFASRAEGKAASPRLDAIFLNRILVYSDLTWPELLFNSHHKHAKITWFEGGVRS